MLMKSMTYITMFIYIFLFLSLILSDHPLYLGVMIISQAVIVSLVSAQSFMFNFLSFLVFMVYLGGILMLFSYIVSISFSNKTLKKKNNLVTMFLLGILTTVTSSESCMTMNFLSIYTNLSYMYSSLMNLTIVLMMILLLIMIFCIFITETTKSSMRSI